MPPTEPASSSRDTSDEILERQAALYRAMTPAQKLEIVESANRTARRLALTGLRHRHPDAAEEELHLRLFHLVLGTDLATRAYGPLPAADDP